MSPHQSWTCSKMTMILWFCCAIVNNLILVMTAADKVVLSFFLISANIKPSKVCSDCGHTNLVYLAHSCNKIILISSLKNYFAATKVTWITFLYYNMLHPYVRSIEFFMFKKFIYFKDSKVKLKLRTQYPNQPSCPKSVFHSNYKLHRKTGVRMKRQKSKEIENIKYIKYWIRPTIS